MSVFLTGPLVGRAAGCTGFMLPVMMPVLLPALRLFGGGVIFFGSGCRVEEATSPTLRSLS